MTARPASLRRQSDAPVHRQQLFFDRAVALVVTLAFLFHPILSARLLKLWDYADYGPYRVLAADVRLSFDEPTLGGYWIAGGFGLGLITTGIPLAFLAAVCRADASRELSAAQLSLANAEERITQQRRHEARFGILYSRYRPECRWWELIEMSRKLALTGLVVYIEPGSATQVDAWPRPQL